MTIDIICIINSFFVISEDFKYVEEQIVKWKDDLKLGVQVTLDDGTEVNKASDITYDAATGKYTFHDVNIDGAPQQIVVGYTKDGDTYAADYIKTGNTGTKSADLYDISGCTSDSSSNFCTNIGTMVDGDSEAGGCSQIKIWEDIKFSTEYLEYYRNPTTDILAAGNVEYLVDTMLLSSAEYASFNNGEIVLNDIGQSTFGFDSDDNLNYLNVISKAEKNKLLIGSQTVILDSGEQVEAVIHIDGIVGIITNDEIFSKVA